MCIKLNNIIMQNFKSKMDGYKTFNEVYIFGSILKSKQVNDVDILIIYKYYSYELKKDLKKFKKDIMQLINLPIHIIALSEDEEHDLKFIERLNYNYIVLKNK